MHITRGITLIMQGILLHFYQVKVSVDSGDAPYNLSLHMSHDIVPEKCFMTLMKSKVTDIVAYLHQFGLLCIG